MIYNLISSDLIKEVTFISVLFAFILTCAAIALGKNIRAMPDVPMPSTVPNPLASRVVPELSLY